MTGNSAPRSQHGVDGKGGGIYNDGTLHLYDSSSVTGNTADVGGGIYSRHVLILKGSSSVTGNTATIQSGGVYRHGGPTSLRACTSWTGALSPNSPDDPPTPTPIAC